MVCFVLICGGSGVSTLKSCVGGGAGAWGTAVLNMDASYLRAVVCFSLRCGMGLDGVGFCRSSIRSAVALVTTSAGDRLGNFFWTRNSSVVMDTSSDDVLVM